MTGDCQQLEEKIKKAGEKAADRTQLCDKLKAEIEEIHNSDQSGVTQADQMLLQSLTLQQELNAKELERAEEELDLCCSRVKRFPIDQRTMNHAGGSWRRIMEGIMEANQRLHESCRRIMEGRRGGRKGEGGGGEVGGGREVGGRRGEGGGVFA